MWDDSKDQWQKNCRANFELKLGIIMTLVNGNSEINMLALINHCG